MHIMTKRQGFTLIEVLVTLVILSFGLLGLAGLIMKGHRASYEAYQRQQMVAIANDLAERIKANQAMKAPTPWADTNNPIAAAYVAGAPVATPLGDPASPTAYSAIGGTTVDCGVVANTCTRLQMVAYDLGKWEGELLGVNELRGGDYSGGALNARGCVEGPLAAPSPPNTYRVSVAWQGDVPTVAPPDWLACGTGLYKDSHGVVKEETRRVISINVTIYVPLPGS